MPLSIKKNSLILSLIVILLVIGSSIFWYIQTAHGVTRTWDGGGGDANWNTAANWSGTDFPLERAMR